MKSGKYRAVHSVEYMVCKPKRKILGHRVAMDDVNISRHTVNAGDVISVSFEGNCAVCDVGKHKIKVEPAFILAHFERLGVLERLFGG